MRGSAGRRRAAFSVTGGKLPSGLKLNAKTGVVSGKPKAAGAFRFRVTARDALGQRSSERIALLVKRLGNLRGPVARLFSEWRNRNLREQRHAEPLAAVDDAELVRRAQLGSAAAFEALVVRHGARLHRYLRVELRHESDAHDALQESLTAAWRGLPGLRRADRFWPWLVGIASHKAADIHRRRGRKLETEAERFARRRRPAARDERGAVRPSGPAA